MDFVKNGTELEGLFEISPLYYPDCRGSYKKCYEKDLFRALGISEEFSESSVITSKKNVLRGLHYQTNYSQGKLIQVLQGSVFDVVVDLRPNSSTFGKFKSFKLVANDNRLLFVPPGFAHGFLSLTDGSIFHYMCSGKYDPASCGGIIWNDPVLSIPWPIDEVDQLIMTEKDKNWPTLTEYMSKLGRI